MKLRTLYLFIALAFATTLTAQPFKREFDMFKKQDSISIPQNPILLLGSSSFTIWEDVQSYFPSYTILNRGFGGSTLKNVINNLDLVLMPYKPKQVIIYCGENDLAENDTITPNTVTMRFSLLFNLIRSEFKDVPISFISIKPSPSRYHLINKVMATNAQIKSFLKTKKKATYINVFDKMLGEDNRPKPEIFLKDSLHMNAKGYKIWQKIMKPYLKK